MRHAPVAKEPPMHPLVVLALVLFVLVLLDLAAYRWGTDTRLDPDDYPDWR